MRTANGVDPLGKGLHSAAFGMPAHHDVRNLQGEVMDLSAVVSVATFHSEFVDQLTPQSFWLYDVNITKEGILKNYDLRLE